MSKKNDTVKPIRQGVRNEYISLQEAASFCDYSQEYLSLRARQGKLKAKKINRNWLTTKKWLDKYLQEQEIKTDKYISLQEAAKFCDYSQEYLSLRARQGNLKADKLGRNWVTTKQWLEEYISKAENYKNNLTEKQRTRERIKPLSAEKKPEEKIKKPVPAVQYAVSFHQQPKPRARVFAVWALVFIILGFGVGFGYFLHFNTDINRVFRETKEIGDNFSHKLKDYFKGDLGALSGELQELLEEVSGKLGRESKKTVAVLEKLTKKVLDFPKEKSESLTKGSSNISAAIRDRLWKTKSVLGEAAAYFVSTLGDGYQFLVKPWLKKVAEQEKFQEEILQTLARIEKLPVTLPEFQKEFEAMKEAIKELAKEDVADREIVKEIKEIKQITEIKPIKELIRETVITKVDEKELQELKKELAKIKKWESDIKELQNITAKLQSHPPFTQITTAPVYIGSSGLEVGGAGNFSSLAVSGALGVRDLGVGNSATIGAESSDVLTVYATANFIGPVNLSNILTVGSGANYLSIDSSGNLLSTGSASIGGNLTVSGNLTVVGAQTYSGAAAFTASSTSAALLVNQTGLGQLVDFQSSGTSMFSIAQDGSMVLTGTSTAGTYLSASDDSTVRKSGEEVLRALASIYRYEMPSQTSTTSYFRISTYFSDNPLSSTPSVLPGSNRVYRLLIKYSDDIATSSFSSWRVYQPAAAVVADSFSLSGLAGSLIEEGTAYITEIVDIPESDWQIEAKLPSDSNSLRIFQLFLGAYDQIQ